MKLNNKKKFQLNFFISIKVFKLKLKLVKKFCEIDFKKVITKTQKLEKPEKYFLLGPFFMTLQNI